MSFSDKERREAEEKYLKEEIGLDAIDVKLMDEAAENLTESEPEMEVAVLECPHCNTCFGLPKEELTENLECPECENNFELREE